MSADETDQTSSRPPFFSTLPPEFLKGLDERGLFLYTKLDEIGQAQRWLVEQRHETNGRLSAIQTKLDSVETQTLKTNGRVTSSEAVLKAMEPEIETVRTVKKLVTNRYFLLGAAAFLFVGLPFLGAHSTAMVEWLKVLFGA